MCVCVCVCACVRRVRLSNSVLFCIPKTQFKEVFFTLCCWCNGTSFNTWLFLQLRLEYKYFSDLLLKNVISCYNILYREISSILLSCCCCRSRSFIQYLRFETLGLNFWHAVFKRKECALDCAFFYICLFFPSKWNLWKHISAMEYKGNRVIVTLCQIFFFLQLWIYSISQFW